MNARSIGAKAATSCKSLPRLAALVLIAATAGPALAQDAQAGGNLFKGRCQMCHSTVTGEKAVLAPNLAGVVGRKAASTSFPYSTALKNAGLVWDRPTLDAFLAAPMRKVPGTRMVASVPDARQRADLLAFLATRR